MSRPPAKPAHIRRLDAAIQADRVLGDSRSVNAWRYDVVLYVEDNDKRVHVIHMDHVRVAEGGEDAL